MFPPTTDFYKKDVGEWFEDRMKIDIPEVEFDEMYHVLEEAIKKAAKENGNKGQTQLYSFKAFTVII